MQDFAAGRATALPAFSAWDDGFVAGVRGKRYVHPPGTYDHGEWALGYIEGRGRLLVSIPVSC